MTNLGTVSRELWRVVEPLHQVAYRSPEAARNYSALGLTTPPQQYFANRLAALGSIGPTTATAVLFGFAPSYVASAVPDVWALANPDDVCDARQEAACTCLVRILGDITTSRLMVEAADLATTLVGLLDFAGTPLAAAWADRPAARDPLGRLWQACTVLREHRGDVHWRATASHGINSVECHILHAADGAMPEELLKRVSGWDDASWSRAVDGLVHRGLITSGLVTSGQVGRGESREAASLQLTEQGRAIKRSIESMTDAHALLAIETIGVDRVLMFRENLRPWITALMQTDVIGAWKIREELWRDPDDVDRK